MRIREIRLENIGCFREWSMGLGDLTVICGENRTGKSTLIYGLYFALFGTHLNRSLARDDLCRKGEKAGYTSLTFNHNAADYWLKRSTSPGLPRLARQSGQELEPFVIERASDLRTYLPWDPEISALTSFFREGELIFFLQDMPRYDKTILETLTKGDEVQIIRSRFRKSLTRAKDETKLMKGISPQRWVDNSVIQEKEQEIGRSEEALRGVEEESRVLAESLRGEDYEKAARMKWTQDQYNDLKKEHDLLSQSRAGKGSAEEMMKARAELETKAGLQPGILSQRDELQRHMGALDQAKKDLEARLTRLTHLKGQADCPTCEQTLPGEKFSQILLTLEGQKKALQTEQDHVAIRLKEIRQKEEDVRKAQERIKELDRQLSAMESLDLRLKDLARQLSQKDEELKGQRGDLGQLEDMEKRVARQRELEAKRAQLHSRITTLKAELLNLEDERRRSADQEKRLHLAERKIVICDVAYRAFDHAVQSLYQEILTKVQTGIKKWMSLFRFLEEFEINLTSQELMPLIRAKGYQYRLEQMSKSERVFPLSPPEACPGRCLGPLRRLSPG